MNEEQPQEQQQSRFKRWLKVAGLGTFLFFLIKGLVWLAVFYFGAQWFSC